MSKPQTQIDAHCSDCLHESKVDSSVIGKKHRRHLGGKWIAGKATQKQEEATV